MSEYQKKYARTDILVLCRIRLQQLEKVLLLLQQLNFIMLFAYVTLGIDGINILKLF
jgi:hypothetical protein